jgi:hypothetical protein
MKKVLASNKFYMRACVPLLIISYLITGATKEATDHNHASPISISIYQQEIKNAPAGKSEESLINTMQKHLQAVSNRNLSVLKTTLSPDGKLLFILPNRGITNTVEDFIHYHEQWFRDTTWTLEAEILYTEVDENLGIAITEIMYREPDRDGVPYFNRMTVSYALKNIGGEWYVFKDHASSVETSL